MKKTGGQSFVFLKESSQFLKILEMKSICGQASQVHKIESFDSGKFDE